MIHAVSRRDILRGTAASAAAALLPARAAAATVAPGDLRSDIALFRRAYTALHPGLYRYNSPARMAERFDRLARWAARPRTTAECYAAFARATAAVRCGHSYPNFYNQSDALVASLFGGRDRMPFHFDWIGGRMIVLRDLSGAGIPPGSEIVTIEGVAPRAILAALMPLSRADGGNDAKRVRNLALHGDDRWEAFDIYLPMVMPGLVARGAIAVALRRPDGARSRIEVPLMTAAQRAAAKGAKPARAADAPMWTFERRQAGVARLTMPDWGVYDSTWPWEKWLNDRMDEIADGTRALIVDLRDNEGGQDCGDLILSRLIDRDLTDPGVTRRVRYRKLPDDLSPHVDTWDKSFFDWGAQALGPEADGLYRLTRWDDDARGSVIRPQGRRFTGKLLVLIDASNSSATFQFARRVRKAGLGTLIGETTGGNQRGINGGAFLFLRLPASGIEIDIPLVGYFPPPPQPDAGLDPDIFVHRTALDIARGIDPVRLRALALAVA